MNPFPRDNLYRASYPALEMRGDFGNETAPTLTGHFAVFNTPTEIDSLREGNFMESIAPGAFSKAFRSEHRGQIKALFQHGRDPQIGDKPLGAIETLTEDERGAYYEVSLLDTSYNRDLLPGLRAGLYGASFRFQVMREDVNKNPGESAANPRGIPERTIREANVSEFGPVTFPAYAGATAGVRSITDTISDVDALAYAGAIILDEERMNQSRVFVSRGIPPEERATMNGQMSGTVNVTHDDAGQMTGVSMQMGKTQMPRELVTDMKTRVGELRAMTMPMTDVPAMDPAQVNDTPMMTMLDDDTCEALGSLIEVCESALEAMESLLGIDDDTGPDADDATGEMNSQAQSGDVRTESLESTTQDAPPDGAADSLLHPIRGRSDKQKSYLRKETPSWQL